MNDGREETVHVATRTHPKVLIVPVTFGAMIIAAGIAAAVFLSTVDVQILQTVAWLVGGALVLFGFVIAVGQILRWRSATFIVTSQQIQTRRGIISRNGSDIPLARVAGVKTERGLSDRIFGCGTLIVRDAGSDSGIVLRDIPRVEATRNLINNLVHGS